MEQIVIRDKEMVTMNLVNYFVVERDYNPVIVHGINDEIWLENMNEEELQTIIQSSELLWEK